MNRITLNTKNNTIEHTDDNGVIAIYKPIEGTTLSLYNDLQKISSIAPETVLTNLSSLCHLVEPEKVTEEIDSQHQSRDDWEKSLAGKFSEITQKEIDGVKTLTAVNAEGDIVGTYSSKGSESGVGVADKD